MIEQLDLFAPGPTPIGLFIVHGYYLGADGYHERPDGQGNKVVYANLKPADVHSHYFSKAEMRTRLNSNEPVHTSKACSAWHYTVHEQLEPLTFDPVTRTYMVHVPPFRWDSDALQHRRVA